MKLQNVQKLGIKLLSITQGTKTEHKNRARKQNAEHRTQNTKHKNRTRTQNQNTEHEHRTRTQNTEPEHGTNTELVPRTRSHTTTKMDNIVKVDN